MLREFNKQREMNDISNLIADMVIGGATKTELERAVMHSMAIIDAEKYQLDWQKSERDNGIAVLKRRFSISK